MDKDRSRVHALFPSESRVAEMSCKCNVQLTLWADGRLVYELPIRYAWSTRRTCDARFYTNIYTHVHVHINVLLAFDFYFSHALKRANRTCVFDGVVKIYCPLKCSVFFNKDTAYPRGIICVWRNDEKTFFLPSCCSSNESCNIFSKIAIKYSNLCFTISTSKFTFNVN